jgi:pimeloyl-ACP methyl ester carboxylesterase
VIGLTANTAARRGTGPDAPPVVLIHGVGFGPATLAPLAAALAPHAQVEIPARRGYGERAHLAPAASVAEYVDDVVSVLDGAGIGRAIVAGMSGGATVALAMALSHPERVVTAIAHEPAVGSMAPELRALVGGALRRGGGGELLRVLAGEETWAMLPPAAVSALDASSGLVEADAAAFMVFEPRLASAAPGAPTAGSPRTPLVCSVGERSSPLRFAVAERLAARTGAPVAVVPGCGHLPQLDAPGAFAELILEQALINA